MENYLIEKCNHCQEYNKKNKYCNYYNKNIENEINTILYCTIDERVMCSLCQNYDPNTNFCKTAKYGKFKEANTIRFCVNFEEK